MTKYQKSGVIVLVAALAIKGINMIPEGGWSLYARLAVVLIAAAAVIYVYAKDKFTKRAEK